MTRFRRHWFDVGVVLGAALVLVWLIARPNFASVQFILWVSLITLFLHQFEEWRWPGWFAGMLNIGLFRSDDPTRYPLNPTSAMVVNVVVGWVRSRSVVLVQRTFVRRCDADGVDW